VLFKPSHKRTVSEGDDWTLGYVNNKPAFDFPSKKYSIKKTGNKRYLLK